MDGRVKMTYSTRFKSWRVTCLGDAVLVDRSSFDVNHFSILKNKKIVRRVKTYELYLLPNDSEGYPILKID